MARRKPARVRSSTGTTVPEADVIVKGFRVARGKPVNVRLINPTPEIATIYSRGAPSPTDATITIDAPAEDGDPVTFDFEVSLNVPAGGVLPPRVQPLVVEGVSGQQRYREAIRPGLRPQR